LGGVLGLTLSLLFAPVTAGPAAAEGVDLLFFDPPNDPLAGIYLEPVATPGHGHWNIGTWFAYGYKPVKLLDSNGQVLATTLRNRIAFDKQIVLGLGERFALGLSLPGVIYQEGDDTRPWLGGPIMPRSDIGPVTIKAKADFLPPRAIGGLRLGLLSLLTAPTGNPDALDADPRITGEVRLLAEMTVPSLALRATLGWKVRQVEEYAGTRFGSNAPWGAGLVYIPKRFGLEKSIAWSFYLEAFGHLGLTPVFAGGAQSPAGGALSARAGVGEISIQLGAQMPFNSAPGQPLFRGVLGIMYAPRFYDQDDDGVADDDDQCPFSNETPNGKEDSDGCPD
jgi:OmpA-OmpF porin, OOP family